MEKEIEFNIRRYKPQTGMPPHNEAFTLTIDTNKSVLDALEKIRIEQDNTLMYRHSCHHSSCGTCGMIINGKERLACITRISQLESDQIKLEPLSCFPVIGDLAVDMTTFFQDIEDKWSNLKISEDSEHKKLPEDIQHFEQFENCIECGCCVSACPVVASPKPFMGPAALAALSAELNKSNNNEKILLQKAASESGARACEQALECSRVCPTKVYPAHHISNLRKKLSG